MIVLLSVECATPNKGQKSKTDCQNLNFSEI